jgi:hypothetical protein
MTMADAPGLMKYAVVEIETVEYAAFAQTALLTADTPVQTYRTLVPDGVIQDIDSAVWTFQLAGAQGTALATALRAAQGTTVEVVFQAEFGVGKSVATFDAVVPAIPFGGTSGSFRAFDINLAVQGQPDFTTSA